MRQPERFVCVGSLNVDITFPVERLPEEHEKLRCDGALISQGGSAANTAHWLARLGHATVMLGCVGDDAFGSVAVAALAAVGVDTRHIQRTTQAATGLAAVFAGPAGKRMVTSGGANACFDPGQAPAELFSPGTHLHVATPLAGIAHPLLRLAKSRGATTSCDLDLGPPTDWLPWLDIGFVNHTELARWLGTDDPEQAWNRLQAPANFSLVVTLGAHGAAAWNRDGGTAVPAAAVDVVDRTGGGDAFDAGYLHALGRSEAERLRCGLDLAAQVIARRGARPEAVEPACLCPSAQPHRHAMPAP